MRARVNAELPAYLETLKALVGMESGSRDVLPRLYLAARMVMDVGRGEVKW